MIRPIRLPIRKPLTVSLEQIPMDRRFACCLCNLEVYRHLVHPVLYAGYERLGVVCGVCVAAERPDERLRQFADVLTIQAATLLDIANHLPPFPSLSALDEAVAVAHLMTATGSADTVN